MSAKRHYTEAMVLTAKLHQRFVDSLKERLVADGHKSVNPAQAMLILNVSDGMTIRELRDACADGQRNLSYNVEKLRAAGYLEKRPSTSDGRATELALTGLGAQAREGLMAECARQARSLAAEIGQDGVGTLNASLQSAHALLDRD